MTIDIFQALGAATEQIAFSELYVALQQGWSTARRTRSPTSRGPRSMRSIKYISLSGHKWESTPSSCRRSARRSSRPEQQAGQGGGGRGQRAAAPADEEADEKHLAEFQANPDLKVNEVDRGLPRPPRR